MLIFEISIYTLSDLGYSSNLIGSLSGANAALFTRYRVDNALSHKTKNKMAGVNSRFASVSESKIVKIKDDSEPENTKKATNSGLNVFKDK